MKNVLIRRSHDRDVQLRETSEIQAHQIERARFFTFRFWSLSAFSAFTSSDLEVMSTSKKREMTDLDLVLNLIAKIPAECVAKTPKLREEAELWKRHKELVSAAWVGLSEMLIYHQLLLLAHCYLASSSLTPGDVYLIFDLKEQLTKVYEFDDHETFPFPAELGSHPAFWSPR